MYGSGGGGVVTGFRMHARGWASAYCTLFGAEAVALAHKLFDKMHCQELLQKDMSAGHVSMRSLRDGIWT